MRALGGTYWAPCFMTRPHRNWLVQLDTATDTYLNLAGLFFEDAVELYKSEMELAGNLEKVSHAN